MALSARQSCRGTWLKSKEEAGDRNQRETNGREERGQRGVKGKSERGQWKQQPVHLVHPVQPVTPEILKARSFPSHLVASLSCSPFCCLLSVAYAWFPRSESMIVTRALYKAIMASYLLPSSGSSLCPLIVEGRSRAPVRRTLRVRFWTADCVGFQRRITIKSDGEMAAIGVEEQRRGGE